jgi:hypothetical protein
MVRSIRNMGCMVRSIRNMGCMVRSIRNMGCMVRSIRNMGCTRLSQPRRPGNLSRGMAKEKVKEGGDRKIEGPEPTNFPFFRFTNLCRPVYHRRGYD